MLNLSVCLVRITHLEFYIVIISASYHALMSDHSHKKFVLFQLELPLSRTFKKLLITDIELEEGSKQRVASNPGFPFWVLSCSFGEKSQKLWDKIRNGKPGFKAKQREGEGKEQPWRWELRILE